MLSKARSKEKVTPLRFEIECRSRGYKVLGEYVNLEKKILLLCPEGHEYEAIPRNFMYLKHNCPICKGNSPKISRIRWEMFIANSKYVPLSEFISSHKKVLVRCMVCGKEFLVVPNKLYLGDTGCPSCARQDSESAATRFYQKCKLNYVACLDEYQDKLSPVTVQHLTCQTIYKVEPRRYMYGEYLRARCPTCSIHVRKLMRKHTKGEITTHQLLEIVETNGWETRLEDLRYELFERDYRIARKHNQNTR